MKKAYVMILMISCRFVHWNHSKRPLIVHHSCHLEVLRVLSIACLNAAPKPSQTGR
ncbi:hypothetical protein HanPSC8_Chr09g0371401 [Helianthus annuus]|nr:hypothetical protein HanPSC8_Chr09g0371401 [Helianthus annuus]